MVETQDLETLWRAVFVMLDKGLVNEAIVTLRTLQNLTTTGVDDGRA